jgi:hypothetical protein
MDKIRQLEKKTGAFKSNVPAIVTNFLKEYEKIFFIKK